MSKKIFLFFWLVFCLPFTAFAQYFTTPSILIPYTSNAPEIVSTYAVLIDEQTGALLYSKNPDEEVSPASLAKLMTMHLLMKEVDAGKASYDEIIPITKESWAQNQPPRSSLMFLAPGQIVTLREIMLGLAIPSGNDAAVAAALRLAPTMDDFAALMTAEARRMGLTVTRFTEASGISEFNMTTAAEFAYFCRQYIKLHPQSLKDFHSVPVFSFPVADNVEQAYRDNVKTITQYNRNNLLRTFPGVDGLKTGYIDESGYNIALTAQRDFTRFIAVIFGAPAEYGGSRIRDEDGTRLLTWAYDNFRTVHPVITGIENIRLWKGRANTAEIQLAQTADFTAPYNRGNNLRFDIFINRKLTAPLPAGALAGYYVIYDDYGEVNRVPLVTQRYYEIGNVFKRFWHSIRLLFVK
jgi:serine-type D-Ala-D-Ala carboxypeptidase (penicillin-binding protein 5/6)